ncbi:Beta-mannanase [Limihaloglobus sulfuriphilus]|uniref:Beta-mannanase n=1 Tax=Limihaloglobus sulfuriphilus TaxID=1851148 RepID=A0A1Q2MCX0_9BACT|nr:glycosyl hydrolase [Limihaloglobus sulfuriphilus]AQQ70520.1 Beta-mannanase [Limihaloglobus sulfuriphilus]
MNKTLQISAILFLANSLVLAAQKEFTTYGNISVGKFYTFNQEPFYSFPDVWPNKWTDGTKLTNETFNEAAFSQEEWLGWQSGSIPVEIVIDLGKSYNIDTVKLHTCSQTGLQIHYPDSVDIWTKAQTEQDWLKLGQIPGREDTEAFTESWFELNTDYTPARYVMLSISAPADKLFLIDEVEIYGNIISKWKHVPDYGMYQGAFAVEEHGWWDVSHYEEQVNKTCSMILWYHQLNPNESKSTFSGTLASLWTNPSWLGKDIVGEKYLTIGWLPSWSTAEDIARGIDGYDEHLEQWFIESIDYSLRYGNSDPIWLRPMNEMNGGWTFPNKGHEDECWGGDQLNYRRAWRRLYNIAEQVGAADKHIFLWSPNGYTYAGEEHYPDNYYPGDQYVDWIGISLYTPGDIPYPNAIISGTGGAGTFDFYGTWPHKPMMISEGAWRPDSTADGQRWLNEWFDIPQNFPRIKSAIWFNGDRKIDTFSPEMVDLYRQRLSEPEFLANPAAGRIDLNSDGIISFDDLAPLFSDWKEPWIKNFRDNLLNCPEGALILNPNWVAAADCDAEDAWTVETGEFNGPAAKISRLPAGQTADLFTRLPSSEHYRISGKIANRDEFANPYCSSFLRIYFGAYLTKDKTVGLDGFCVEIYRNAFGSSSWADGFRIRDEQGVSLVSNYLGKLSRPYEVPFVFERTGDNVYISIGEDSQKIEQHIVNEFDPNNSALRFYHTSLGPEPSDSWVITDLEVLSNAGLADINGDRILDYTDLVIFSEKWLQKEWN